MKLRRKNLRLTTWEKVDLALIIVGFLLAGIGWLIDLEIVSVVGIVIAVVAVVVSPFEGGA